MKRILTLIFCVTILFSTICLAANSPNHSKSQLIAPSFPNVFRPIGDLFKKILRIKPKPIICPKASVENLILSEAEITIGKIELIQIYTYTSNPNNDALTYNYTVSGGKIIGKGEKVIWDLSNVKAGTYTITAAVDDGCGFCGKTVTKTITIKLCPDCK